MIFAAFSPNKFNKISGLNLSVTLLAANARSNDKKKKLHPSGLSGIFTVSVRILLIKESKEEESLQLTSVLLSLSFARILAISNVAAVAEWYRYRTVACLVTISSPVPLKTRRVGQRCTLNLSTAETSSRWCDVVVRRGGASSGVVHVT
ncbi:uncharacterized protein TNCV_3566501 [Trichonephila clavipes]|nr:uncharacterized protein TNCV_3566501 [Trichonephila clavipes]